MVVDFGCEFAAVAEPELKVLEVEEELLDGPVSGFKLTRRTPGAGLLVLFFFELEGRSREA